MFSKQFFLVLIFRLTEGAETERNAITHLTKISSKAREGRCLLEPTWPSLRVNKVVNNSRMFFWGSFSQILHFPNLKKIVKSNAREFILVLLN